MRNVKHGILRVTASDPLDTNFLIRALVDGAPEAQLPDEWVASETTLAVSAAAWCEFLCGPLEAGQAAAAESIVGEPLPFISDDARVAAQLFNLSGRRRGTFVDCMIAAGCIRAGASLATANLDDFRRFVPHGLRLAS